jgi:hypothetical protein
MGNITSRGKKILSPQEKAIEAFVEAQIQNADINITCIPDGIEKEIYINLIKILLGNLHQITQSVRIEILNHVITLHIEPKETL